MILKQLPTMINDLNKLGIALKSLDAMKIGTVGVNVANVEAYRNALKGLSVEQSVFALASKGATEEQIRQILVTDQAMSSDVEAAIAKAGLTTATKALTREELIGVVAKTGMAKKDAEQLLIDIGLISKESKETVVKKQLTMEILKQAVATGKLNSEKAKEIALSAGLTSQGAKLGNVTTGLFSKAKNLISSHPYITALAIVGSIGYGVYKYYKTQEEEAKKVIVEAHETAEQALEDTKTSLSDDKSELQSVNSELETTKERLKEISSIGAPTLTEQNELTKLSTANAQLEAQQTLLENNIKLKQKSAALDAKKLLGTQVEMKYSDISDGSSIKSHNESYTYKEHAKYQALNLRNAYNKYMGALKDGNAKQQALAQELIDTSGGNSAELTTELLKIVESFKYDDGTIIEGYEDLYSEYMGMIYNLQSLTNPDTFLEIAKSVTSGTGIDYEKAISDAYKLAYEGNFDVTSLNQDFVKALADAGIEDKTIEYIFKLKQQEYQLLVDKINSKYDSSKVQYTYWDGDGNIHHEYEKEESAKADLEKVNQELNQYAKENPIEFQLVSSYDENFALLDKYIEEEKTKAENSADYVGDYVKNAIRRIYDEARVKSDNETDISIFNIFALKDAEGKATALSNLSDQLSEVENAYNTCLAAKEEYDKQGYLSVDTLQKVLSLGDEYLQYLFDEEGNVRLDAEAFQQLTLARINDMEAQALNNLAGNIQQITNEASATEYLAQKQNDLANSYADVAANALLALSMTDGFADSEALQAAYDSFATQYEQIKSLFANAREGISSTYNGQPTNSSKSDSDSKDLWKEEFQTKLALLDHYHEMGYIKDKQYYEALNALNEEYFAGQEKYLDDYRSYAEKIYSGLKQAYKDMLDEQKGYMDQTVNAVTDYLDEQIDGLNDQIELIEDEYNARIDAIESEKEALEAQKESVQGQIDNLNDQIEAIEKANEARQKAIDLQKKQYELNCLMNQKTQQVYQNGQFVYTTDDSAISDARQEVDEAKTDIQIDDLNNQIDNLNSVIDGIDTQIDALDAQIDTLENEMNHLTDSIRSQINDLQNYRDRWAEIPEQFTHVQNQLMAQMMLGQNWQQQALAMDETMLMNFGTSYNNVQGQIQLVTNASAEEIVKMAGLTAESLGTMAASADESLTEMGGSVSECSYISSDALAYLTETGTASLSVLSENVGASSQSVTDSLWDIVTAANKACEALAELSGMQDSMSYTGIQGFYNGGVVEGTAMKNGGILEAETAKRGTVTGKKKSKTAKALGEDYLVIAREGEGFVPPEQVRDVQDSVKTVNKLADTLEKAAPAKVNDYLMKADKPEFPNAFLRPFTPPLASIIDIPKMNLPNVKPNTQSNTITFQSGAITLNDVQDVNTLGDAIANKLPNLLTQKLNQR